ncbi:hypothetical protein Tco_1453711 [Tanacetum coccineum]
MSPNPEDDLPNDDANKFSKLLSELGLKYQEWPLSKKEFATSMITKLVNKNDIFFEPVIQRPKRTPPKSKKKRGITSTTKDPSRFEYVESFKTDNPSSSTSGHHENNLIDLNVNRDASTQQILRQRKEVYLLLHRDKNKNLTVVATMAYDAAWVGSSILLSSSKSRHDYDKRLLEAESGPPKTAGPSGKPKKTAGPSGRPKKTVGPSARPKKTTGRSSRN